MSDKGEIIDSIRMVERKNQHNCCRIIPESLKKLVAKYNPTFPITMERFQKLRRYCIESFGRFYSLRSLCITSLVTAAIESNNFHFHHHASTTMKYYLDLTK